MPLVAVCAVLIMIFSGYSAVRFLNDAVNGLLTGGTVAALVALKVLIALEVLLPVTLYLAVVLALSRLYSDSEIVAMEAAGISLWRLIVPIFFLSLFLGVMVTGLSLYARPWAYQKLYDLDTRSRNEFDIAKVEAGRFYELGDDLVFFAEQLSPALGQARNVWIWKVESGKRKVTRAQNVYQVNGPGEGQKSLVFENGYQYALNLKTGAERLIQFGQNVLRLESAKGPPAKYRRKAASTAYLARSKNPEDIAEFQWRLSTGISTVLMSLMAIPLSRVAPRRGKYGKATVAIILFFVIYNFGLIARTWVEKQVVGSMPGIWWVTALHAVLVLYLLPIPSFLRYSLWRRSRTNGGTQS